jgi:hypothetical protein
MSVARILGALLLLISVTASFSRAQFGIPDGREINAVRASVLRFVDAMEQGDAATLKKVLWAAEESPAQLEARGLFADLVAAEKTLERAGAKRFGEDGKRLACGFNLICTTADRKGIERARISLEEGIRFSQLYKEGESTPIRLRRPVNGEWQVVLDFVVEWATEGETPGSMRRSDSMPRIRLDRVKGMIAAIKAVAARVEAGELPSAVTAETDLIDRLAVVTAEAVRKRLAAQEREWKR